MDKKTRILNDVRITMEVEGFELDEENEKIIKDYLDKKISYEEGIKKIKNKYTKEV